MICLAKTCSTGLSNMVQCIHVCCNVLNGSTVWLRNYSSSWTERQNGAPAIVLHCFLLCSSLIHPIFLCLTHHVMGSGGCGTAVVCTIGWHLWDQGSSLHPGKSTLTATGVAKLSIGMTMCANGACALRLVGTASWVYFPKTQLYTLLESCNWVHVSY